MTEVFRFYDEHYEVSDLGNVKKDGVLINQFKDEYYYNISYYGKPLRVHVMVAELFPEICGEKIKWGNVHHINRNQLDNRAVNLKWLTMSEHKKLHQKEDGVSVPVKAYDLKGNYVGRWDSMEQAAAELKACRRHISRIVNGKERRFTEIFNR